MIEPLLDILIWTILGHDDIINPIIVIIVLNLLFD